MFVLALLINFVSMLEYKDYMLHFGLLAVGKVKDKSLMTLINQYQKMLSPYGLVSVFELKPEKFSESNQIQAQRLEQFKIDEFIDNLQKKDNWTPILLTETGKRYNSVDLAKWLSSLEGKPLFILGGALGFDYSFKSKHKTQLSLSDLTFTHEMARLVLFEQLYRVTTILNNKNYHY